MIGQFSGHSRSSRGPFGMHFDRSRQAQAFVRTNQVVISIFPGHCRLMHRKVFRESQGFTSQTSVEQSCGQVAALDISCTFSEQFDQFSFLAPNGFQFHFLQPSMLIALFDHLQIAPVFARFRSRRRTASASVFRYKPINRQDGFINPAPSIRDQRRRTIRVTALSNGLKYSETGFGFIFANPTRGTQATVHIDQG